MKLFNYLLSSILFVVFTVALSPQLQAQDDDPVEYNTVDITNRAGTTIYAENNKDIQGNPLIKDSFENGRILFDDNKASKVVPINYDAYKNQILFIENNQIKVLNLNGVKGFVFEEPANFNSSDKVQEVFTLQIRDEALGFSEKTPVQVLYNQGTGLKLLAVHRTSLMKGNSKDPYTGKVTDRYINRTNYFLQTKDGDTKELRRLRDKDIIKALGKEHRKDLRSFMKSNDLDGRSQKDLAKLLAYYDNDLTNNL